MTLIPHSRPWLIHSDLLALESAMQEKTIADFKRSHDLRVALADKTGFDACQLFGTGTLALYGALRILGVKASDGIALPSFTCPDLVTAITSVGCIPVILDCDENGLLAPDLVLSAFRNGDVKAAVAVHQFGLINHQMAALTNTLPVVEDCAHVPPRQYLPGSIAVFGSLEGTKFISAGEGGYLLFNTNQFPDLSNPTLLGNRLSDLVAVIALCQLRREEANLKRREEIALLYSRSLPLKRIVNAPRASWFRFLIRADSEANAHAVIEKAKTNHILFRRPIMPAPLHRLLGMADDAYPNATGLWKTLVSVPLYPDLSDQEIRHVGTFLEYLYENESAS